MDIWVNWCSTLIKSQWVYGWTGVHLLRNLNRYMYGEAVLNSYLISMSGWVRTEVQVLRNLYEYMGEPWCNCIRLSSGNVEENWGSTLKLISVGIWANRFQFLSLWYMGEPGFNSPWVYREPGWVHGIGVICGEVVNKRTGVAFAEGKSVRKGWGLEGVNSRWVGLGVVRLLEGGATRQRTIKKIVD